MSFDQSLRQVYEKNNIPIPSRFSNAELRSFLTESIKYISSDDFKYLFDDLTKDKTEFTKQEVEQTFYNFEKEAKKVFNRIQTPIANFMFQSLIRFQQVQYPCKDSGKQKQFSQMILDRNYHLNQHKIDIDRSFSDILTQDYLKKLINMGANGLINQKQEDKVLRYSYNHWIQTNQTFSIFQTESSEVQLIKSIWGFDFKRALQIGESIYSKLQESGSMGQQYLSQISSLLPGLQNLSEIATALDKYPSLKPLIENRVGFDIQFREEYLKKMNQNLNNNPEDMNLLQQQFNDLLRLWNFTQEYFEMIENELSNPYFKQIASFISFGQDDKYKSEEQIEDIVKNQQIGIVERFLYTKKYFSQENFQMFKEKIRERVGQFSHLDYILLFGNKKQSQIVLQNYLDATNNIEKVALISVYLKTFSQQARAMSSLRSQQKSCYGKFIYVYEWLLDKADGGISRHVFDKKCLSIQIQRKRKNLTKTFTFDCTNCKSPQIYSALSKKINIDSKQPKLKGYHYFAKDNRSQIMHCIQCMIMLPKCSICLYPISVYNAYAQQMKKNATQKKAINRGQAITKAVVWCPKCKHGGHFDHIMKWFQEQKRKCPVSNCKCKCTI